MPLVTLRIPFYLPAWVHRLVVTAKRRAHSALSPALDLSGDRDVEWAFIAARLPDGPGRVLDFGASSGNLSIVAALRGFHVLAIDLAPEQFPWTHTNVDFLRGDLLKLNLPNESFDMILNCSTIEHVGLSGRYDVGQGDKDGDLRAMQRLHDLMKPSARMLMTIPCGRDGVIAPWHRVYGDQRLPELLRTYFVEEESFWVKQSDNRWHPCDRASALSFRPTSHPSSPTKCSYALGCFVLRRK